LAAKDLVGSDLTGAAPTGAVEDGQQDTGPAPGGMTQPAQFCPGRRGGTKDYGEENVQGRQTNPAGLAGGGELGLFVPVHDDGVRKTLLQLLTVALEGGKLLA
jgi:hypothetical protein